MKYRLILVSLSIIILAMDNNFLFKIIKENPYYHQLRLKVRKIKNFTGMNENLQMNNSINNTKLKTNLPNLMNSVNAHEFLFDYKKIEMLIGRERSREMKTFIDLYRNSSNQTNIIFLGDFVHEFMYGLVDTLFVPFDGTKYCYKIEETEWCHISNLNLYIYPAVVQYNDGYMESINYNQYINLKNKTSLTIEGSEGTLINLVISKMDVEIGIYYLFGYMNEIFVSNIITNTINTK